jgi:hypothetical protein
MDHAFKFEYEVVDWMGITVFRNAIADTHEYISGKNIYQLVGNSMAQHGFTIGVIESIDMDLIYSISELPLLRSTMISSVSPSFSIFYDVYNSFGKMISRSAIKYDEMKCVTGKRLMSDITREISKLGGDVYKIRAVFNKRQVKIKDYLCYRSQVIAYIRNEPSQFIGRGATACVFQPMVPCSDGISIPNSVSKIFRSVDDARLEYEQGMLVKSWDTNRFLFFKYL